MSKNPSVFVQGAYGVGNFGDDALMFACHAALSRLLDPEEISIRNEDVPYVRNLLPQTGKAPQSEKQAEYDCLMYGGGTQFYSFPLTRVDRTRSALKRRICQVLSARPRQWLRRLRRLSSGRRLQPRGRKNAALGIGVGPFVENSLAETRTRKLFRELDFIAVRDPISLSFCRRWGIENAILGADLCFLPQLWGATTPQIRARPDPGKTLGVIVRDWPHSTNGAAYEAPLCDAVFRLRKSGIGVRFVSFCSQCDTRWLHALRKRSEHVLLWDPDKHSLAEFIGALNNFDCLLSARYHGAVFGAILGRPTVCIEVEQKLDLASQLLAGGGRLWRQPFDTEDCVSLVQQALDDSANAKQALTHVRDVQGKLALRMVNQFSEFLEGATPSGNHVGCRLRPIDGTTVRWWEGRKTETIGRP